MVLFGDAVARDLCGHHADDFDDATGWRVALQAAAERSDLEAEILTIADQLHALAIRSPTLQAVQGYVDWACGDVQTVGGRAFIQGMLGHLSERAG